MRYSFNVTRLAVMGMIIFAIACASCNKKDNTSTTTTTVKCVSCANGGICLDDTCTCPAGYEGTNCETVSRDKFLGNWTVFEKGTTTGAAQYAVSVSAGVNIADVIIQNFNNYFSPPALPINGYVSGDSLYIPNQQEAGKVVFGKGYVYSNVTYGQYGSISLSYEVIDTATLRVDDYGYYAPDLSNPSAWNK